MRSLTEQDTALADLLLSIADDKFVLGHRAADWTGLAPILEEDIAFSSIAQDEISHAMALYEYIARLRGESRADDVAYGRTAEQYRCAALVELADEFNYAVALVRQFLADHLDTLRLARLSKSANAPLAALAARMAAEERIHQTHSDSWIRHLGRGAGEARQRVQAALDLAAPLAPGLFEPTDGVAALAAAGIYPGSESQMFDEWSRAVSETVAAGGLRFAPLRPEASYVGGRHGRHSDAFREMLAELTEVYRLEPQAAW